MKGKEKEGNRRCLHEVGGPFHDIGMEVGAKGLATFRPPTVRFGHSVEVLGRSPVECALYVVRATVRRCK